MNHQNQQSGGFHRVMQDVIELCELQWQLLAVDGEEAKRRGVKGIALLVCGALVLLAAFNALVIGVGYLLHEYFEFSIGIGIVISCGAFFVLALISCLLGARSLGKANESLAETKREFAENVRWIKSVVLSPRTSARNQLRRESFPIDRMHPQESPLHAQRY